MRAGLFFIMQIYYSSSGIILRFKRPVRALSSASVGGGLVHTDLVVNLKTSGDEVASSQPEELVSSYLRARGESRDAVGLLTSADMAHAQFILRDDRGIAVIAAISAGTSNAINSSEDTGSEYLGDEGFAGTINIIVVTNRELTAEAMVGAVIVATEAKSAALFDLKVTSVVTGSQATGTGTDSIAVVSGTGPAIRYAGAHTRFGQLLGDVVYRGVLGSLQKKETDTTPLGRIGEIFDL